MTAILQAERAARRYVDSAHFLIHTAETATKTVAVIETALVSALRALTPSEIDELLRSLGEDLPAVVTVLAALDDL